MEPKEEADLLTDVLKWFPVLDATREQSLDREAVEHHLDVSRATSYRVTRRLCEKDILVESNGEFALSVFGERTTEASSAFETAVWPALPFTERNRDRLIELIGLAPVLDELGDEPLDRRELEQRLDVSKTTSYRFARSLTEMDLIEKFGGRYERTSSGDAVMNELASFETIVRTSLTLAPLLEVVGETTPPIPIEAFSDATVTTLDGGDAYSQLDRFIALTEETDTLRGIDLNSIAPLYIEEITKLVLDGMELEMISTPAVVEDTVDKYPYACAKLCINGNVTPLIHEQLPFGLAIYDDCVGIGVPDRNERRLRSFVETDADAVHDWAETVFESYHEESVRLRQFSRKALRDALPQHEIGVSE